MGLLLLVFAQFDFPSVLAGHGYQFRDVPSGEPGSDEEEGGIGTAWILAVLFLALLTVGVLVSLDPSGARKKLRRVAPKALILVAIAAPLVAWTASAGGDEKSLTVERSVGLYGAPELLISLGDEDLNTLETTDGERFVHVECVGRDGQVVLAADQAWPFVDEPGFDYPHAHQVATREQLQRADRCRLGVTRVRLEADVSGVLTR